MINSCRRRVVGIQVRQSDTTNDPGRLTGYTTVVVQFQPRYVFDQFPQVAYGKFLGLFSAERGNGNRDVLNTLGSFLCRHDNFLKYLRRNENRHERQQHHNVVQNSFLMNNH